jgi:hypothetical protein
MGALFFVLTSLLIFNFPLSIVNLEMLFYLIIQRTENLLKCSLPLVSFQYHLAPDHFNRKAFSLNKCGNILIHVAYNHT